MSAVVTISLNVAIEVFELAVLTEDRTEEEQAALKALGVAIDEARRS